jgi:hypothetical protein
MIDRLEIMEFSREVGEEQAALCVLANRPQIWMGPQDMLRSRLHLVYRKRY